MYPTRIRWRPSINHPVQIPQLRFHSPAKQFYVYLGKAKGRLYFGREEAKAGREYKAWKSRFLLAQAGQAPTLQTGDPTITVTEAVIAFLRYAENYYRDSRALNRIQHAMNVVMDEFGSLPVRDFRSRALKHVQQKILVRPILWKNKCTPKVSTISRFYANRMLVDVLHCWRWLVSEEIVPPDNLAAMEAVQLVHQGHGGRETARVPSVDPEVIEATLAQCIPPLAAMLRVQRLTGMRPGELCRMRRCDLSLDPKERIPMSGMESWRVSAIESNGILCWLNIPRKHKNLHRGKPRAIVIGPQAQAILAPMLEGKVGEDRIFDPRETVRTWRTLQ